MEKKRTKAVAEGKSKAHFVNITYNFGYECSCRTPRLIIIATGRVAEGVAEGEGAYSVHRSDNELLPLSRELFILE